MSVDTEKIEAHKNEILLKLSIEQSIRMLSESEED